MAKFLGLIRLSGTEASRMLEDGLPARREFIELIVREGGGTVEHLWLTNVGDWDLVCVVDMAAGTAATGAAATLARRAAGLTGDERWIELAEVADVADAIGRLSGTDRNSA